MSLVYLAGPITGLSYGDCTDWREHAIKELTPHCITGLSPMRAKDYLSAESDVGSAYGRDSEFGRVAELLSSGPAIVGRDRFDTQRSDVVLMNVLGANRVSIGTMIEMGWADAARVPVILVMEPGNVHEHGMLVTLAPFRALTLEEGLHAVKAILGC